MRLHHLEITAFGPFVETVTVDFDLLSDAGLFLLSGPTGSGKTSVLDAVCFALYGAVPGDRNGAKRLRSDQAGPDVEPRVSLEATLAGRRFRLVRSPAWERPKRRGTGLTTQQASVTLTERIDGRWQALTTRLDEAGDLVSGLMGMNLPQFVQVALLPQGRFQAFLRASSDERHRVLERLFQTGRFGQVEIWLKEHRVRLRRVSDRHHRVLADLVSRHSEAAGSDLPDSWDLHHLQPAVEEILPWAERLAGEARSQVRTMTAAAAELADAEQDLRHRLEEGQRFQTRISRHRQAASDHRALLAEADEHRLAEKTLAAARRAAVVLPLQEWAEQSAEREAAAEAAKDTLLSACRDEQLPTEPTALSDELSTMTGRLAAAQAAVPRAQRLAVVRDELDRIGGEQKETAARIADTESRSLAGPAEVTRLEERLLRSQQAELRSAADLTRLRDVEERIATGHELARIIEQSTDARAAWLEARSLALACQEELLELRRERIDSMAAELADALAVGHSCPVCGSQEHPAKAASRQGAPDAAAERAAQRALDDAKSIEHLRDGELRDLQTRRAFAEDRVGSDGLPALQRLREELEERRQRDELTVAERPDVVRALAEARDEQTRLTEQAHELTAVAADLAATERSLRSEESLLADELRDTLGGHRSLDEVIGRLSARITIAGRALEAIAEHHGAARTAREAHERLLRTARGAGFDDVAAALLAAAPPERIAELTDQIDAYQRRLTLVQEVLSEPDAAALATATPPDLGGLAAQHDEAQRAVRRVTGRLSAARQREQRLGALVTELAAALEAWAPVRAELQTAVEVSSFVEGKSPENRLQMRLSAYVLAYRLSQVVAAANERLSPMSDQRYSLEHTGTRGAGESRGGLSLLIRDDWSGEARDPATLSGGETFIVSLALALGLADVVSGETGGAQLDTLFVDEGFGSLDADTLDGVMDVLDSLRNGGRIVGVVSHVAEMRDRIPSQLRVAKARAGSTLTVSR